MACVSPPDPLLVRQEGAEPVDGGCYLLLQSRPAESLMHHLQPAPDQKPHI